MSVFALLERLAPHVERELNLVINSKQEAESLSSKLKKILVGLEDAERKRDMGQSVKDWLKEVEDVTYEMDDVLDELQTANLQVQVEGFDGVSSSHLWEKVRSLFLSLCLCFNQVVERRGITIKMKALSERVDNLLKNRGGYTLVSSSNKDDDGSQEFKQEQSTSLADELKTYGLDTVKESLVEKLVNEGRGERSESTEIISIVGIGGVGKTTLAQLAYNDPEVVGIFAPRAWVSVSKSFDASSIARAILEVLKVVYPDTHNLETLVQHIKKALENKRFLLVLDNVWTEDRNKWESLKRCLKGARGSRILVTTRSESAARMMGTVEWQQLGLLSDSDCGTILNGIALEGRREKCEKLEEIGIEIAKKCNGLPLAARSVGSMLVDKSSVEEWKAVLESPLWKDKDQESDLFRLLNLSYIDLSPLLKRCFLTSVVFPKGALVTIDEISRIWMAYGYLSSNGSTKEVQLKGLQYFNHLAMRSFFQKFQSDEGGEDRISYKMHDIMHDFANYLSGSDQYSFIMDGGVEKEKRSSLSSSSSNNLPWNSLGKLRTFCARHVSKGELLLNIIGHLISVRVLSMSDCELQVLPLDIGKLIHLRHLNLSGNPITQLPESVCDLCNLQTLAIEKCYSISSLPQGMAKLINLRHLANSKTYHLKEYSQGVEKLTGLCTLSEFKGSKLGYLRNLNQLQGSLYLDLINLKGTVGEMVEEVGKADLKEKKYLKKLRLRFGEEEEIVGLVDAFEPPPNLETLVVGSASGKWLCHWIATATCFDNLKVVEFDGYWRCSNLPPFGNLPALEKLTIKCCNFRCLSSEFLGKGSFPRLKKLNFGNCREWEEWKDVEEEEEELQFAIFSRLEELEITGSPHLQRLPHTLLGVATSLQILKLSSPSLYDRYKKVDGYELHALPHIHHVNYVIDPWDEPTTESQLVESIYDWITSITT